jgi:hypothetical protein
MGNIHELKLEFDAASRDLIGRFFDASHPPSAEEIQAVLDRMSRTFNALLISTLDDFEQLSPKDHRLQPREFVYAYALDAGDNWTESNWQIVFVNGQNIDAPVSLREYTRQMVADGWRVINPPAGKDPRNLYTPDGRLLYELYFCREQAQDSPASLSDNQATDTDPGPITYHPS